MAGISLIPSRPYVGRMTYHSAPLLAGVDATRDGWIAAIAGLEGPSTLECFPSVKALLERDVALVIIDIPIGLPDARARGCDVHARRSIGRRRSSVFAAPRREMLDVPDQATASRVRERLDGTRCSVQLFSILKKIGELDRLITPQLQDRVREGHPEVSFTALNGGEPMSFHKGTPEGARERLELLRHNFADIEARLASLPRSLRVDAIDA